MKKFFVIGDIHGRMDMLMRVIEEGGIVTNILLFWVIISIVVRNQKMY